MKLQDALDASLISAARGYDKDSKCVVSVAIYGDGLMWLTGWGGNWTKVWKAIDEEGMRKLQELDFKPSGPKPENMIEAEIRDALADINTREEEDDFEPIGESLEQTAEID